MESGKTIERHEQPGRPQVAAWSHRSW